MSRITTPGKFEGESLATVYLYEQSLNGCDDGVFSDGEGGDSYTFILSDGSLIVDATDWSDDEGRKLDQDDINRLFGKHGFCVNETSTGFVSFESYSTEEEYNAAMANVSSFFETDDELEEESDDDSDDAPGIETNRIDVIVANVGTVYTGTDYDEATRVFNQYLDYIGFGRSGTSDITMISDGDIIRERIGTDPLEHDESND
jgi:hypothetical protein